MKSAPIYNGKDTIVEAYRSTNPSAYLMQTIPVGRIQERDLLHLINHVYQQNAECPHQQQVRTDITMCREHTEEQTSDEGQLAKFVYFCTAIPHLWVRFGDKTGVFHLMTVRAPIVTYMTPNKVCAYAWFNFHKDRVVLLKHTLPQRPHPLKVLYHSLYKDKEGAMKMEDHRTAFELSNNNPMATTKQGNFLQFSFNKMNGKFDFPKHGATTYTDFVVILTTGAEYQLAGIYFNDAQKRSAWPVAALLHDVSSTR